MTTEPTARPGAQHTEVSAAYLRQLDEERETAMRASSHPGSAFAGASPGCQALKYLVYYPSGMRTGAPVRKQTTGGVYHGPQKG